MKQPRLSAIFVAVTAASLMFASSASFAAHPSEANFKGEVPPPCPPVMMLHDGFYIGAGVGYDSYKIHHSSDSTTVIEILDPNLVFTDSSSGDTAATGWMGGVFAGYGHYFDWMYLGLELNANTSAAKTTYNLSNTFGDAVSLSLKARTSYGVALLPGLKLNDSTLLYVRLAYLRANFKAHLSITDSDIGTLEASDSRWRNAFQYGIGLETYVAENISVRGEFDHSTFKSRSFNGFIENPGIESISTSTTLKPSNNEFMFSLLYHFC